MKNFVLNILSLLCLLAAVLVVVQNLTVTTDLNLLTATLADVSVGLAALATGLLMAFAVAFRLWETIIDLSLGRRKANRQLEQAQVTAESSGEKVRALENKVATLEKALESALRENEALKAGS